LGKFSKSETEIETSIEDVLPEVVVTPPPPYSTQALIEETFE
jgi:reverse gyrase